MMDAQGTPKKIKQETKQTSASLEAEVARLKRQVKTLLQSNASLQQENSRLTIRLCRHQEDLGECERERDHLLKDVHWLAIRLGFSERPKGGNND